MANKKARSFFRPGFYRWKQFLVYVLIHFGRWYGCTFSMRLLNKSLPIVCKAVTTGSECQNPKGHLWMDMYCCFRIYCFCFRCLLSKFSTKHFQKLVTKSFLSSAINKKPRFIGGACIRSMKILIPWNACPATVTAYQAKPFWIDM